MSGHLHGSLSDGRQPLWASEVERSVRGPYQRTGRQSCYQAGEASRKGSSQALVEWHSIDGEEPELMRRPSWSPHALKQVGCFRVENASRVAGTKRCTLLGASLNLNSIAYGRCEVISTVASTGTPVTLAKNSRKGTYQTFVGTLGAPRAGLGRCEGSSATDDRSPEP